ncbi:YczE/YyaS/YitT family protein [Lapidilactobacillus luobeiensis]|uniref:YczE/YyaS/YitT family protein n=1 Tax=Lapidilactobacillus luobeiensis TaxID=2950371 RepID=UPI0021C2746A|nr:hypothetical protein [Lapidilactobacillus luobeiensis]
MLRRLMITFAGTFLIGLGIAFLVDSGVGIDPLSTFLAGVQTLVPWSLGNLIVAFNVVMLIVLFFLDRHLLGIGSVINATCVGLTVDLLADFNTFITAQNWPTLVLSLLGIFFLGTGSAVYMEGELGYGALEGLMMFGSQRLHWQVRWTRNAMDLIFIVLGILFGAHYGYGTILSALLVGQVIGLWRRLFIYQAKRRQRLTASSEES